FQSFLDRPRSKPMGEKQGCSHIARTVDFQWQSWRLDQIRPGFFNSQHLDQITASVCTPETCHNRHSWAHSHHHIGRPERSFEVRDVTWGQILQLELVWRNDRGCGQSLVAHEFRDARAYEESSANITHNRITAVYDVRIGPFHPSKGV